MVKQGFRKRDGEQMWACPVKRSAQNAKRSPARTEKRKARNKILKEAAKSGGCQVCGLTPDDKSQLHFHHKDPATKSFRVGSSESLCKPIGTFKAEVAKCEVLCAKCHREKHLGTAVTL